MTPLEGASPTGPQSTEQAIQPAAPDPPAEGLAPTATPSPPAERSDPILSAWYVVAASHDLRTRRRLTVSLLGKQLLLSRQGGRVIAEQTEGGPAVSVQEIHGLIWLCPGEASAAPPLPELIAGASIIAESVVQVRSDFDQAVLGLVDPAHVPMVHRSWWWRPPSKARRVKTKAYAPSPHGFTARAVDSFASAPIYDAVGRTNVEIEFRLPSIRNETIVSPRLQVSNLTTITPMDNDRVVIRNVIYANRRILRVLKPLLSFIGTVFLQQDAAILRRLEAGRAGSQARRLFVGDPDRPSLWYYQLKSAHQTAERGLAPFTNPVRSAILRWNTCWLLCLTAPF